MVLEWSTEELTRARDSSGGYMTPASKRLGRVGTKQRMARLELVEDEVVEQREGGMVPDGSGMLVDAQNSMPIELREGWSERRRAARPRDARRPLAAIRSRHFTNQSISRPACF